MTRYAWFLNLILSLVQVGRLPASPDGLTPAEKERLGRETNIETRIRIYESASERIQGALRTAVGPQASSSVPDLLLEWRGMVAASLKDIEKNVNRKKKSRALIRYEIQLRKAIAETQNHRLKAPVEQEEAFEDWLASAERARSAFVDILFPK